MSDNIKVTGMVLSAAPMGENDRRVVLLTRERGKISAFARGARRQGNSLMAACNPFAFGEFELHEGRSSYTLYQANISNYFRELAADGEGAFFGFYFLELADYYGKENVDALEMLKLLYVTCRALMTPSLSRPLIRRIYEMKALVINGEYPECFACTSCGQKEEIVGYSAMQGGCVCKTCMPKARDAIEISQSALYTLQFIICTPVEKLYTFKLSDSVLREVSMVLGRHMDRYVDRRFKSLEILQVMVENS